jgi:hypothetical protein
MNAKGNSMNFYVRKQELLERATHVDKEASRAKHAQAQDVMRALAALYREMAEELAESGLFERRLFPLDFALPDRAR